MTDIRPITWEIRSMATAGWDPWPEARERLLQKCDAIDSIHANLEREHGELRMKYVNVNRHAEHVKAENESMRAELASMVDGGVPMTDENMAAEGWVRLPRDADGEYIHVDDRLLTKYEFGTCTSTVEALILTDRWDFELSDEDGDTRDVVDMSDFYENTRHAEPETWETIIKDAIRGDGGSYGCLEERFNATVPALVARCRALAGDAS